MIEGQFPAFEKVIALTGDKKVELQRDGLATAIRRVSLLSSERSRAVRLTLGEGKLDLSASSPDLGEAKESLSADYKGAGVEIGFNAQYLLDFLAAAGTDAISLELKDHESQGLFRPHGESATDYRYIVMPMRL
jgi:DNA polymerase-3 subunit beta